MVGLLESDMQGILYCTPFLYYLSLTTNIVSSKFNLTRKSLCGDFLQPRSLQSVPEGLPMMFATSNFASAQQRVRLLSDCIACLAVSNTVVL